MAEEEWGLEEFDTPCQAGAHSWDEEYNADWDKVIGWRCHLCGARFRGGYDPIPERPDVESEDETAFWLVDDDDEELF